MTKTIEEIYAKSIKNNDPDLSWAVGYDVVTNRADATPAPAK